MQSYNRLQLRLGLFLPDGIYIRLYYNVFFISLFLFKTRRNEKEMKYKGRGLLLYLFNVKYRELSVNYR